MVQPQLAVNHKGSQNDAAGISTHGTVKPVCTVHYVETVAIRHHVAATVRQADEVPESAFIFRHHFFRQRVHRRFDIQKILAKQVRQKNRRSHSSTFRVTGFAYCMMYSSVVHIFRDTGRCRASIKAGR
uniref:Uncharacterized protein n=1 Tax=Escherichia coli TaxID=562 RepID=A0A3G4RTS8_ECOLX|nr:hypothetical protein D0368_00374 [Escherichia coli]